MNDLINRKKLLDEIDNMTFYATLSFPLKASKIYEIKSIIQKLLDSIIEIIKNSPSESGWISCSERLPENNAIVFVPYERDSEKGARSQLFGVQKSVWYVYAGLFLSLDAHSGFARTAERWCEGMRKLNLYELLKMIDCNDLELPLYADEKGKIACEPQSVYKVTLRFSAEEDAAVTVPISSPLLIPWYDCEVWGFSPNDVEDSMDVWLEYDKYVMEKWSNKIIAKEV